MRRVLAGGKRVWVRTAAPGSAISNYLEINWPGIKVSLVSLSFRECEAYISSLRNMRNSNRFSLVNYASSFIILFAVSIVLN